MRVEIKKYLWDSADLNRGPSVPNARGWTKLPYYPKGHLLSNEIILYIAFVRTWGCHAFSENSSRKIKFSYFAIFPDFEIFPKVVFFTPSGDKSRFLSLAGQGLFPPSYL